MLENIKSKTLMMQIFSEYLYLASIMNAQPKGSDIDGQKVPETSMSFYFFLHYAFKT